jgi:ankyrin repeat protein
VGNSENAVHKHGNTPLHLAIVCDKPGSIMRLVSSGADINARGMLGIGDFFVLLCEYRSFY